MCQILDYELAENKELQRAFDKSITVLAGVLRFSQLYNIIVLITLAGHFYFLW